MYWKLNQQRRHHSEGQRTNVFYSWTWKFPMIRSLTATSWCLRGGWQWGEVVQSLLYCRWHWWSGGQMVSYRYETSDVIGDVLERDLNSLWSLVCVGPLRNDHVSVFWILGLLQCPHFLCLDTICCFIAVRKKFYWIILRFLTVFHESSLLSQRFMYISFYTMELICWFAMSKTG